MALIVSIFLQYFYVVIYTWTFTISDFLQFFFDLFFKDIKFVYRDSLGVELFFIFFFSQKPNGNAIFKNLESSVYCYDSNRYLRFFYQFPLYAMIYILIKNISIC